MILQTTNNFITSISNTLKNKLLDVDINANLLQYISETLYAFTVPNLCMHHIMQLLGKKDIPQEYLSITVDGAKFIKTLGPRYKLYMSRNFLSFTFILGYNISQNFIGSLTISNKHLKSGLLSDSSLKKYCKPNFV